MLILLVEYRPARQADKSHVDALGLQLAGCLKGNRNLTAAADDRHILVVNLVENISPPGCTLNGRALEVRQVLPRKREDRRRLLALESDEVGCGCFVTVCWAPEVEVGDRTQMDGGFDRLVSGTVFSKADGIVRGCTTSED